MELKTKRHLSSYTAERKYGDAKVNGAEVTSSK
jgi:hypothetical protein